MFFRQTLRLIVADTRERCRLAEKRYSALSYLKLLFDPPALAVVMYRLQHGLYSSGWKRTAGWLQWWNTVLFTADISSQAEIGEHFILYHANGIHIGAKARLGNNVTLVHHNTIATGPRFDERPDDRVVVEDNTVLGCGARVVGNLTVGHDSFVGAGAVVTENLPPYSFHFAGPGEKTELV